MDTYFWIFHGEKVIVSDETANDLRRKNRKVVCLCDRQMLENGESCKLSFETLFMDERFVERGILIESQVLRKAGGINKRLLAKQEYELGLRVIGSEDTYAVAYDEISGWKETRERLQPVRSQSDDEGFMTDAYVTGRYYRLLQEKGLADTIVTTLWEMAYQCREPERAHKFLEDMVRKGESYQRIYRGTQPILIYLGVTYCYNILNVFAREMAKALEELGEQVVFYDTEKDDTGKMAELVNCQYKASVGFQTWAMSVRLNDEKGYIQDRVGGPKYNFIVDHPIWLKEQLQNVPKQFYVLTHDRDYQDFVQRYFGGVKDAILLPPGGRGHMTAPVDNDREQDITFLGTYGNYRTKLKDIAVCVPRVRHLAACYLGVMKRQPDIPAESAFKQALRNSGIVLAKEDMLTLFYEMKPVIQTIMYYYREKVVEILLKSGLKLHVYGDSWKNSPFYAHSGLCIHPEVNAEQGIEVLQNSKISLNVMAWHKDGFTERIADSMLAGAVVVSDWSRQLEEAYKDEVVLYNLSRLDELPGKVYGLLQREEERKMIAQKAKTRALKCASWEVRAREFLEIVESAER